jgi:hypothetical protein
MIVTDCPHDCDQDACDCCPLVSEESPDWDTLRHPLTEIERAALNRNIVNSGYGNETLDHVQLSYALRGLADNDGLPQGNLFDLFGDKKVNWLTGENLSFSVGY